MDAGGEAARPGVLGGPGSRPALPHSGCATLGKPPSLSGPDASLRGQAGHHAGPRQPSGRRAGTCLSHRRPGRSLPCPGLGVAFLPLHRLSSEETTRQVRNLSPGCPTGRGLWGGRNGRPGHGEEREARGSGVRFARPPPSGDCALWAEPPPPRRSPPCVSQDLKPAGPTGSPRGRDAGGTHLAASCTHGSEATGLRGGPGAQRKQVPGSRVGRGRGAAGAVGRQAPSSLPPAVAFAEPAGCGCLHAASSRWAVGLRLRDWTDLPQSSASPPPSTPSPKAQLHLPAPGCPAGSSDLIFLLSLPLPSRPPKPSQYLPSLPVGK